MGAARDLVDRAWQIMDAGRFDELGEVFTEDCDFRLPGIAVRGPAAWQSVIEAYYAAFPDLRHDITSAVESGEAIACEVHLSGTHKEPLIGPAGAIPASGNQLDLHAADMITLRDGKIATWHAYFDQMTFLGQIGALPASDS